MNTINFELYHNFCAAAEELNLELIPRGDNACIYVLLPEVVLSRFCVMLWTPINLLNEIFEHNRTVQNGYIYTEMGEFVYRLRKLEEVYNRINFHLEFMPKSGDSTGYGWFPWLDSHSASKEDIVKALEVMLDVDRYDEYLEQAKIMDRLKFG